MRRTRSNTTPIHVDKAAIGRVIARRCAAPFDRGTAMYQVAFAAEEFPRPLPLKRDHRDVLVQPMTGDAVDE